jgi:CBS domain-containing protein
MAQRSSKLGSVKEALEDIASAGDAARVQLHLLFMGVRDRKDEIETNLERLEDELDRGIEQAMKTAATKTRQLTKSLKDILGSQAPQHGGLVHAIMTGPAGACSADEPLQRAAQLMWDLDCGVVPVVDAEGRLAGILTDRDICMAAYTKALPLTAIRVDEVMTTQVVTCAPSDPIERAVGLMEDHQLRRLAVVTAERRLVGMLSLSDIAQASEALPRQDAQRVLSELLRAVSKRRTASEPDRTKS